jgi:hypothetical protein
MEIRKCCRLGGGVYNAPLGGAEAGVGGGVYNTLLLWVAG